jgi:solute carrier family 10 (sodium/bile acid cotransporter), member 7
MKKIKVDTFVLAMIAAIMVAWLFPGVNQRLLGVVSSIGVSLIFFFYGLRLHPQRIISGLRNWKLHVAVQMSTFLLFPLVVIVFYPFIHTEQGYTLWLSFLFLAALPSTVSSSVVMVSIARGNIPGAIFNASISGLIGIVVTPLWMGIFLQRGEGDFNLAEVYLKLITEILLPLVAGLLLHKYLGDYALKHTRKLTTFDRAIILLIIYKSFSVSFQERIFHSIEIPTLLLIFLLTIVLFVIVYFITGYISKKAGFSMEDQITTQFCGTKKSLVHGTVFSKILFPQAFPLGIILLPLMIFHTLQILCISIIATRLEKRDL